MKDVNGIYTERLKQAREEFPCIWTSYSNGEDKKTCYWDLILKDK